MVGYLEPLAHNFKIVNELGFPTTYFIRWAQQKQLDISEAVSEERALEIVQQFIDENPLQAGTDISITPDGKLSSKPIISHKTSGVSPGVFGSSSKVPKVTVNETGHIVEVEEVDVAGGSSLQVSLNGTPSVSDVSVLNFTGGVSVSTGGPGEAIINITGGGGGGMPSIVQSNSAVVSSLSSGISLPAPPSPGSVLVVVGFVVSGDPGTASGWTSLQNSGAAPSHRVLYKIASGSESSLQSPFTSTSPGILIIYEISGAAIAVCASLTPGTAATLNVNFATGNTYLPTSSGIGITFGMRLSAELASWAGSFAVDYNVLGSAGILGGAGGNLSTAISQVIPGPVSLLSSTCIWPSSLASKVGFILIA